MRSAPRAASDRPLVRKRSIAAPQGPLEALSKISKSHMALVLWNQFYFSCPRASVVGTISAAEATFPSTFAKVRSSPDLGADIGSSLRCIYNPTTATMQSRLTDQLRISNSHLLKAFCDALYSASFLSIRWVKSKEPLRFEAVLGKLRVLYSICKLVRWCGVQHGCCRDGRSGGMM